MAALVNALSVGYGKAGYAVNYGVGRGIGASATAVTSLVLGFVIAKLGNTWMLVLMMAAWTLFGLAVAGYPSIAKPAADGDSVQSQSCHTGVTSAGRAGSEPRSVLLSLGA